MALIHQATLVPSKLVLLMAWLPSRPWFTGEADVKSLGSFRFDDPSGEVGIETILVQATSGPVFQVPLTYRDAPRVGAEEFLVGTTEHSVLGTRWVYDGCGDPVWATALVTAVLTGGTQAAELVDKGGHLHPRRRCNDGRAVGLSGADRRPSGWYHDRSPSHTHWQLGGRRPSRAGRRSAAVGRPARV